MNKDLARKLVKVIVENFTDDEIDELSTEDLGIYSWNIPKMAQIQKGRKTFEVDKDQK